MDLEDIKTLKHITQMESEYIKNPLNGAITKEGYDTYIKMGNKLRKRAKHLYELLNLGDNNETILNINFYADTVGITTWYTCMGEYDENEYSFQAEYLYMNDNEVLRAEEKRKEEEEARERREREIQEQKVKEAEERRAKAAEEKKKKQIDAIKESVSIINTNLTPEELTKLCKNIYHTVLGYED